MAEIDSLEIKITANTADFDRAIDRLNKKMAQIGKGTSSGGNAFGNSTNGYLNALKRLDSGLGRINKSVGNTMKSFVGLGKSFKTSRDVIGSLASAFGKFYASMFLVIRGVKGIGRSIESSMGYIETYNYFFVAMNKIGEEYKNQYEIFGYETAEAYYNSFFTRMNELTKKMTGYTVDDGALIQSLDKSLGIDPSQLMQFQAQIGSITNSVGLIGETSLTTSKALSMLAGDLSSLTNRDLKSVMNDLTSGMVGMSRAMYKYGIDITATNLEQVAFNNGINKAVSEMTQAEKMQLRLLAILNQSRVAWGDLANTINSSANQYRMLQQQIANLSRTLGDLFLPIVQTVLPFVNGLVISINMLLTSLGFKLFGDDWKNNILDGISSGNSAIEDMEGSLDDATESAKKLKNTVLGIDELNVLSKDEGSGSVGGSGGVDLSKELGLALSEYEKRWEEALAGSENRANEWAEKITEAFSRSLAENLGMIPWEDIFEGARDFGREFAQFLNRNITPENFRAVGETIGNAIKTSVLAQFSFNTSFNWGNLGVSIAEGINGFLETYPWEEKLQNAKALGSGLATMINSAVNTINAEEIGNYLYSKVMSVVDFAERLIFGVDWEKTHSKMKEAMKKFTSNMDMIDPISGKNGWEKLGTTLGKGVSEVVTFILNDIPWLDILEGAWDTINSAIREFSDKHPFVLPVLIGVKGLADGFHLAVNGLILKNMITGGASAGASGGSAFTYLTELGTSLGTAFSKAFQLGFAAIGGLKVGGALNYLFTGNESGKDMYEHPFRFLIDFLKTDAEDFKGAMDEIGKDVNRKILDFSFNIEKSINTVGDSNKYFESKFKKTNLKEIFNRFVSDEDAKEISSRVDNIVNVFNKLFGINEADKEWLNKFFPPDGFVRKRIDELSEWINKLSEAKNADGGGAGHSFDIPIDTSEMEEKSELYKGLMLDIEESTIATTDFLTVAYENMSLNYDNTLLGMSNSNLANLNTMQNDIQGFANRTNGTFNTWKYGINSYFSKSAWTFPSVSQGLTTTVTTGMDGAIRVVESKMKDLAQALSGVFEFAFETSQGIVSNATATIKANFKGFFAAGGFPEDGLFFANHNELVGQFTNGKTAVANNAQIVEGIRYGVRSAVSEELSPYLAQISNNTRETAEKDYSVNIGDREIARANMRGSSSLGMRIITQG